MRYLLAVMTLVGGLIVGCGTDTDTRERTRDTSTRCVQAMRAAAAEPDPARADPLIVATLSSCRSVDEWMSALRRHPAAMGLKGSEFVDNIDVQAACRSSEMNTPVCRDAAKRGIVSR